MPALEIRQLGLTDYAETLAQMQAYTAQRNADSPDQLWVTEHPPVYTLGLNRRGVRLPQNDIPVVNVDRGGKITYHGPGQLIIYCLIDLARSHLNVRQLVSILEDSLIEWLAVHGVVAVARADAPGVYVAGKKNCFTGATPEKPVLLPWSEFEYRHGFTAVCRHRPLRLCRHANDANPGIKYCAANA